MDLFLFFPVSPNGGPHIWFSEILKDFKFLNAKMYTLPLFYLFWVLFHVFCWFLAHFVYAKLLNRNIGCVKKFTFRKSAPAPPLPRINGSHPNLLFLQL